MTDLTNVTLLDRYRLETELGRGDMGAVYRGFDTVLERTMVVKVLSGSSLGTEGRGVCCGIYIFDRATWNVMPDLVYGKSGFTRFNMLGCALKMAAGWNGEIWLNQMSFEGTGFGVLHYDGEGWTHYAEEEEEFELGPSVPGLMASDQVADLAVGSDGTAWFSTYEGLAGHDCQDWFTLDRDVLGDEYATAISASGPNGNTWFATTAGFAKYDGETWTNYTVDEDVAEGFASGSITQSPDGNVWMLTTGCIGYFDGDQLTIYTHEEEGTDTSPASYVGVMAMAAEIAVDPEGAIWLAAGPEGILRIETD